MTGIENDLYAYAGKILRVNLSNGEISTEPTSNYAKEWLGSSGIAIKILYDELRSWVTPYDPANRLIIGAGALVGTTAPGANKMNISTLGPMIGGWASSCSDSYLGGQLKRAGYDSVVVQGKAHTPVYLWVDDDTVEIRDASHLWGKTTWETLDTIRETLGDQNLHLMSIGPAGENLVRGACIIQDKGRAFGRGGVGAVMGSKNLKAVIVRGSGAIRVANRDRFMAAAANCHGMFKGLTSTKNFHKYGTLGIMEGKQAVCGIAYKNFQDSHLPEEMAFAIDPKHTIEKYQVAKQSYPGCGFGGCSRIMHITEGPYAGLVTESTQWEVVSTIQGRLAVEEPTFMFKANTLCNQYGLDVDAAGAPIGWAMECYERGIIDEQDTDGIKLNWGDAEAALELIRKIAFREGFGNILAEGCARAADIVGRDSEYYALNIKGLDLYEPCRGALGWCLGAVTSTRGGGHTTGAPVIETQGNLDIEKAKEVYGIDNPHKAQEYEGKAKMVTFSESLQRANNCLGVCHYNTAYFDPNLPSLPDLAELYSAATGWETSVEDLKRLTLKQINLEKALNLRFTDFERKDDMPTPRELNEPIASGNLAGWKIHKEKFNRMLDEYYDLHGWDRETSFPKRQTLIDLDLEYVADDLENIGKLC
ncbi:MAG: aldehyde ferredoxin oxidoreductase family protein [Deltaproteobacteria bacterium]|nr:aldehyde ferredoxin oxidoreductase family protein [Deltaproteobacteria bacterium]MBW1943357.1 aldehyde ferredoxin oxidoreductase family protein [Deltaproteobacteria bacterium]